MVPSSDTWFGGRPIGLTVSNVLSGKLSSYPRRTEKKINITDQVQKIAV